jgi:hypothetical protein
MAFMKCLATRAALFGQLFLMICLRIAVKFCRFRWNASAFYGSFEDIALRLIEIVCH